MPFVKKCAASRSNSTVDASAAEAAATLFGDIGIAHDAHLQKMQANGGSTPSQNEVH
jgi:hypothetical protein